jgi:hypothetical protein
LATSPSCRNCGTHLSIDTQFCPTCGTAQASSTDNPTYISPLAPPALSNGSSMQLTPKNSGRMKRRSLLIGLLGGTILTTGSGVFILKYFQQPEQSGGIVVASKTVPVPTPTATASTMNWASPQSIVGQKSKTAPTLAVSPNGTTLHLVFVATDNSSLKHISSADNGKDWGNYNTIPGQSSNMAPALAATPNGTLHLVFVTTDGTNDLLYISSSDSGTTWNTDSKPIIPGQSSNMAPALAATPNGTLHLVFVATDGTNNLLYTSSPDSGTTWNNYQPIPGQFSKMAPALVAAPNGTLHLVFVANNSTNSLLHMASQDYDNNWSGSLDITNQSSSLAPALAMLNNTLYLAFVAKDNQICIISSKDGRNWTTKHVTGQTSLFAPTLSVLNNTLYLAFIANDGTNQIYIISSS